MTTYKAYGSLNNYKLCNRRKKEGGSLRKLIVCILFFGACFYFAMMVMSAVAAPYDPDLNKTTFNKTTEFSSETRLEPQADPCLPLLRRAVPVAPSATLQSSAARDSQVPLTPGQTKAASAVMALGLVFGARYALNPYTLKDQATQNSNVVQSTLPLPLHKPSPSPALSVAAYRSCKKRVHLSLLSQNADSPSVKGSVMR